MLLDKMEECGQKRCCGGVKWSAVITVFSAMFSGGSHAVAGAFAVLIVASGLGEFQILFMVAVSITIVMAIVIRIQDDNFFVMDLRTNVLLFVNGVVLLIGDACYVYAVVWAPLGNVTTIINAAMPFVTSLIACVALKELWRPVDAVCAVVNIIGIIFITCPTFIFGEGGRICDADCSVQDTRTGPTSRKLEAVAYALAFICAICYSVSPVSVRAIKRQTSVSMIVFYQGVVGMVFDLFLMYLLDKPTWKMGAQTGALLFGVVLFDLFELWLGFYSLQSEGAATIVLLSNVEVVVAYILSFFLLHRSVSVLEISGAVLVIISTVIVGITTCWSSKTNDEEDEESYAFLESNFP
ncbi:solute carrier family 35 member G2-like [Ptychodera flava]|uniref:solute carrier family 35 member G2-like n=1 Tax=Ptychodera flava TaxID=63121 RepID=UPI003969BD1C